MSLAGLSILLAEDNATNQMVATHMLEALGAEVTLANDGVEALDLLGARPFDIALVDIEMPRLSGLEVMRRLRADPGPVGRMPVIALTGYLMRENRIEIEEAGADGIIAKPITSIARFGDEIIENLSRRRAAPRAAAPAEPPGADGADFDPGVFEALSASFDPALRRELASRVAADIGEASAGVARSVRAGDMDGLRTATHPLMAVAGMIGAYRLERLARRLNAAAHVEPSHADAHAHADAHTHAHAHPAPRLDEDGTALLREAETVLARICRDLEEVEQ